VWGAFTTPRLAPSRSYKIPKATSGVSLSLALTLRRLEQMSVGRSACVLRTTVGLRASRTTVLVQDPAVTVEVSRERAKALAQLAHRLRLISTSLASVTTEPVP
jgi:hypothetical protein